MEQRFIYPDEWYPVWRCCKDTLSRHKRQVELTEAELNDLIRVEAEFANWQRKLADLYGQPIQKR